MATVEEAKEQIKSMDISSIVNLYHPVSKKGKNYIGICPFHADTKPSMSVNDLKGLYKCFACGAGGDAIKFVQDFERSDFIAAIKSIGERVGIVIDELNPKKKNPKQEMGLRVLSAAYKLYNKFTDQVKPPRFAEFLDKRRLNAETIEKFGISYSPGNNALRDFLSGLKDEQERSFAIEVAKQVGIIRSGDSGDYDFFRHRIMFPIWDQFGKIRGFSSRASYKGQKPKYLNSGESFVFDKGNILYGLNFAKQEIRLKDSVILAEGNMDVAMMHQFGFTQTVGIMGTAFSNYCAKQLSNLTKNVYLALDNDHAGQMASTRACESLFQLGIVPKFIDFTPYKDPDEFLQELGKLKLLDRINNAPSYIEYYTQQLIANRAPETTDQKLQLLEELFSFLSPLGNKLSAIEEAVRFSKSLGLLSSAEDIAQSYRNSLKNETPNRPKSAKVPEKQLSVDESPLQYDQQQKSLSVRQLQTVNCFIKNPECLEESKTTEILDFIGNSEVKEVLTWLKNIYEEIDQRDYIAIVKTKLEENYSSELKSVIADSLYDYSSQKLEPKVRRKLVYDLLFSLREEQFKNKRHKLLAQQKKATTEEDSLIILQEIQKNESELLAFVKSKNKAEH